MTTPWSQISLYSVLAILEMTQTDPDRPDAIPTPFVDYHTLRDMIAEKVPPGYAARFFNRDRDEKFRRANKLPKDAPVPPRSRTMPIRELVQRGQVALATKALNANHFERTPPDDDGKRTVRLVRLPRIRKSLLPAGKGVPIAAEMFEKAEFESPTDYATGLADVEALTKELNLLMKQIAAWEEKHPKPGT